MSWHIPQATLHPRLNTGIHPLTRAETLAGLTAHQRLLQPQEISVGRKELQGLKEQQERLGHKGLKGQQEQLGHKARPALRGMGALLPVVVRYRCPLATPHGV